MAKKAAKSAPARPATPGDAPAPAAAAPRAAKAKAKAVKVDGVVSAKVRVKNAEGTKRGPGRPRKEEPGNLYEVTYHGSGKSAETPQTKVIRAPDTSTAICEANRLNDLSATHKFVIKATLINESGVPLDPTFDQTEVDELRADKAAENELSATLLGDKPVTEFDPLQQQNLPRE